MATTAGFGPNSLQALKFKGKPLPIDWQDAVTNVILMRTMMGISTVTIQLTDPNRVILPALHLEDATLTIDNNLSFSFAQLVKASDQLQIVFEPTPVSRLKLIHGAIKGHVSMAVTDFIASLCHEAGYGLVAPDYATTWRELVGNKASSSLGPIQLSRGTTADPNESSWGAMNRIVGGIGWRLWEYANTFFMGPDEYWLGNLSKGVPPINHILGLTDKKMKVLRERTDTIQIIDFDHDKGKPLGQATVTALMDGWDYNVGEIVEVKGCGPGDGLWMISQMQRDAFLPQATLTLTVPLPYKDVVVPTSLPKAGFPLLPLNKKLFP